MAIEGPPHGGRSTFAAILLGDLHHDRLIPAPSESKNGRVGFHHVLDANSPGGCAICHASPRIAVHSGADCGGRMKRKSVVLFSATQKGGSIDQLTREPKEAKAGAGVFFPWLP